MNSYSDVEFVPSDYKILVVDDVKTNVLLLQTMMKRANYVVVTASSGTEAIEKVKTESPDLIFGKVKAKCRNQGDTHHICHGTERLEECCGRF